MTPAKSGRKEIITNVIYRSSAKQCGYGEGSVVISKKKNSKLYITR